MSEMDDHYRRDYHTEHLCREAVRAIDAVLADDNARLSPSSKEELGKAMGVLTVAASHLVAVWE